jgi:hypothetical protein
MSPEGWVGVVAVAVWLWTGLHYERKLEALRADHARKIAQLFVMVHEHADEHRADQESGRHKQGIVSATPAPFRPAAPVA